MTSHPPESDDNQHEGDVPPEASTGHEDAESQPPQLDEDYEDEVEVVYVGAPTQFYDPETIGDAKHDAPRPSTIPRREKRAEIRDNFEILREAATLSKGRMEQLALPQNLRQLLMEIKHAEEHKGSRRFIRAQLHRLTSEDSDILFEAMERLPHLDREAAEKASRAESWARALLAGGKPVQTAFFETHQDQDIDHQNLRSHIRQAAKNLSKLGATHDKTKKSLKDLRKTLRKIELKPCPRTLQTSEE